ncbi:MAG: hypothetical protein ACRDWT_12955 [Jatrophihabitantaceae bacterium]
MRADIPTDADEEVLGSSAWRAPRWLVVVVAAALLAAVTVFVRHELDPPGRQHVAAHRTPARPVPTAAPAEPQIALTGTTLLVLRGGGLRAVDTRTDRVLGEATVPYASGAVSTIPQLALDPAASLAWVVTARAAVTHLIEYRLPSLLVLRDVPWLLAVRSAAAFAGHLYLSTDLGTADLAPGGLPRLVPGLSGAVGTVVADPSRGRVIAMDLGYPTELWTYRSGGKVVQSPHLLQLADGSISVVAGRIWVAGADGAVPRMLRLDPRTLTPMARAVLPTAFGTTASIVSTGSHVLWLRGAPAAALWCVDAGNGRAVQSWAVDGTVASSTGVAYLGTGVGVMPLPLSGCGG